MIKGRRRPAERVHVPLRRLALCLDCEECFEIGDLGCPACGSETWAPLARFLENGPSGPLPRLVGGLIGRHGLSRPEEPTPRHLIIVAASRVKLYDHLRRAFSGNDTIQVILDRRGKKRRRVSLPVTPDRRSGDRRTTRDLLDQVEAIGWVMVLANGETGPRRTAR